VIPAHRQHDVVLEVMKNFKNFIDGDLLGVHFAVRIFVSAIVLWMLLRLWVDTSPIWAISSMIAVSDPHVKQALLAFRGRIINALLGCITGLLFLVVGGTSEWKIPLALLVSVLLSSYLVRVHAMWPQAPITAAIVIAGGLTERSKLTGVEVGLRRGAEVMLGCVVALAVTWIFSKVWPPQGQEKKEGATEP
jgi:uncharacterized membrane protein YccC